MHHHHTPASYSMFWLLLQSRSNPRRRKHFSSSMHLPTRPSSRIPSCVNEHGDSIRTSNWDFNCKFHPERIKKCRKTLLTFRDYQSHNWQNHSYLPFQRIPFRRKLFNSGGQTWSIREAQVRLLLIPGFINLNKLRHSIIVIKYHVVLKQ